MNFLCTAQESAASVETAAISTGVSVFSATVFTQSHNGAGSASTGKDGSFTSSKGIGAFHTGSHSSFFNLSMACAVVRPSVYFK